MARIILDLGLDEKNKTKQKKKKKKKKKTYACWISVHDKSSDFTKR